MESSSSSSHLSASSHLTPQRLRSVNQSLERLYELSLPNDRNIRESIVSLIQAAVSYRFRREIEVSLYGSCAMSLELRHSDIDVTVVIPADSDREKKKVWKDIECALSDVGVFEIHKEHDEYPRHLLVLKHKPSGIGVDLTLNNFETAYIAKFIEYSISAHPLVKMLILTVKEWLKDQEVKKSMLPSVSPALMCIAYLQERKKLPVLPTEELVCSKLNSKGTKGEFYDAALEIYKDAIEQSKAENPFNNLCIGEIVHDFFNHYSLIHNFKEDVISVLGRKIFKKDIFKWRDHYFAILDPFSWTDIGMKVTVEESNRLHNLFIEAERISRNGDLLSFDKAYKHLDNGNREIDGEIAVVMMQEGRAEIFLIGTNATITCCRSEASIPRKHGPDLAYFENAVRNFFESVAQAILKYIDFQKVRCAIIGSPGFFKDQFHRYLMEAESNEFRAITENKSRIFLVHTTSGYKHSLREVLLSPDLQKIISDTRAVQETRALEDFFTMLSKDPNRACHGQKHVEFAFERMAVHTLLITDALFRSSDKKYVTLVNSIKDSGGTAHILSSLHSSGEQLALMTGIAAILLFPLPQLDDIEM